MNADDPHFGPMASGDPLYDGDGEMDGEHLTNGFHELTESERNPKCQRAP